MKVRENVVLLDFEAFLHDLVDGREHDVVGVNEILDQVSQEDRPLIGQLRIRVHINHVILYFQHAPFLGKVQNVIKLLQRDLLLVYELILENFLDPLDSLIQLRFRKSWSFGFFLLFAFEEAKCMGNESVNYKVLS